MKLDSSVAAVVTGGASGIGAAAARMLAAQGAKVVVADLNAEKGEALAKEVGGVFVAVDVTKTDDIIAATELAKTMGPVRVHWIALLDGSSNQLPWLRRSRTERSK